MKNSRLGHHGHFLLLRGGGWIRSKVLARNSQGPHCDWPVGVQQTPVLPVPALLCPWCSFGEGGTLGVCSYTPSPQIPTPKRVVRRPVRPDCLGLQDTPRLGPACGPKQMLWSPGSTRGTALGTQLVSVTAAAVKGF